LRSKFDAVVNPDGGQVVAETAESMDKRSTVRGSFMLSERRRCSLSQTRAGEAKALGAETVEGSWRSRR
jgi:hypothetical protein